jgi:hypothetical protein
MIFFNLTTADSRRQYSKYGFHFFFLFGFDSIAADSGSVD